MKPRRAITHLLFLILGYAGALPFLIGDPDRRLPDSSESQQDPSTHRANARAGSRDRSRKIQLLWGELVRTPMESRHRETLKGELLKEWAERDPMALLEFLLDRPWTSYSAGRDAAIRSLARDQPDLLLNYALRCGCRESLDALATTGDPKVALERLLKLGEENLPADLIATLFQNAGSIDPEFYKQADRLGPRRDEAILTATEILFDGNQLDAFLEWIEQMPGDPPEEAIAVRIANLAFSSSDRLDWVTELPDSLRDHAINHLFTHNLWGNTSSIPGPMKRLNWVLEFHRRDWLDPQEHLTGDSLSFYLPMDSLLEGEEADPEFQQVSDSWREWADELPDDPDHREAKLTVYQQLTALEPDRWPELLNTQDPGLRDQLLARMTEVLENEHATQALSHIGDPELKEAAEDYLKWLEDGNDDPFAEYDGPQPWRDSEEPDEE